MMKFKVDKFVFSIIIVVLLAYIFPQPGSSDSKIPLGLIGSLGVSAIFFLYGLKLHRSKILGGLTNWKLHLLIHLSTFLFFPLIVLVFYPLVKSEQGELIWLGFLFLAALPSTVSSSVVMVSIARGNIPAAIFNASISGLIGIVVTPLWMGLFIQSAAGDFNLAGIYLKLIVEILLPILLGIALQNTLKGFTQKFGHHFSTFDKSIILLIIYKSFAESFERNVFSVIDLPALIFIFVAVIILFWIVFKSTGVLGGLLNFNTEDNITAQYCGTKKSLVHGTVFSSILFADIDYIGIILLPLMLFHAIQIFLISIDAARMAKRIEKISP